MINFTRVKYQNFLGCGNAPITIDLDKHATTLILGPNGAGKSTMSEAVCFGLFGKPLRNVNKPKLVNSINRADCLVELWFSTSVGNYCIRRGMKPAIFEIFKNDVLEPIPASLDDYQTTLESILKLNYKSFKQVVILGSASYMPFMRLPAAGRRGIIEDILDIEVFSGMNAIAKDEAVTVKAQLEKGATTRRAIEDQLALAHTFVTHLAQQNQQAIVTVDTATVALNKDIADLTLERAFTHAQVRAFDPIIEQHRTTVVKWREFERMLDRLQTKAADIHKDHAFYESHTNCPECEQVITDEFKQQQFSTLTAQETTLAGAIVQCQAQVDLYRAQVDTLVHKIDTRAPLAGRLSQIDGLLPVHVKRLRELQAERTRLLTPPVSPTVDVGALRVQLADVERTLHDLSGQKVILDAATMLLKDTGIKTRVIRHYLPIINKTVNHYLTAMDFPILFELDESFTESMKSRHRDEFTYELFSEGEKKRIDLALLLTWRDIAKLKNSAATNLLILDEVVFDSSLDTAGVDECLKILGTLQHDTNVWVISHRTDQLLDRFANTMLFEKHKGFSRIH